MGFNGGKNSLCLVKYLWPLLRRKGLKFREGGVCVSECGFQDEWGIYRCGVVNVESQAQLSGGVCHQVVSLYLIIEVPQRHP